MPAPLPIRTRVVRPIAAKFSTHTALQAARNPPYGVRKNVSLNKNPCVTRFAHYNRPSVDTTDHGAQWAHLIHSGHDVSRRLSGPERSFRCVEEKYDICIVGGFGRLGDGD